MPANDEFTRQTILYYLEQFNYWVSCFKKSGDIQHFDNAERYAEVIREYLPTSLQELSHMELRKLHQSLFRETEQTSNKGDVS